MTKIFEFQSKSATIPSINNFIQTNIKLLPIRCLVQENSYKYFEGLLEADKKSYPCMIVDVLQTSHKHIVGDYSKDINALRKLRDTTIAHSDKKAIVVPETTWKKIDELSDYVIEYLDIVEHVFLKTSRSIDSDAKRPSDSLNKMLLNLKEKA